MFYLYPKDLDKREREQEEESEDLEAKEPEPKKYKQQVKFQEKPQVDLTKEQIGFRSDSPGPEGLYDPHKDLWVQWHTDGIANPKKRKLFIRELRNEDFQWRRNKAYQKLRELKEDFLNGLESLIAGYSDPFENLRKEYADTRWNRIENVSLEGDKRIERIQTLCQNISKVFEEQGYCVLNSQNPETVQAIKETVAKRDTSQSTGEN